MRPVPSLPIWWGEPDDCRSLKLREGKYADGMTVLKAQLRVQRPDPDSSAVKNWGSTLLQRSNNMGAYYNYFLLQNSDVGAYVHNPTY